MAEQNLAGKIAVVTGAGSGIGRASAEILAKHGATVIVGYHNNSAGADDVVAGLAGSGHIALSIKVDDSDSIRVAVGQVKEKFGKLDIMVNSAGNTQPIPAKNTDDLTDEIFDDMMRVNVRGIFAVIREFLPLLKLSEAAAIINIGSLAGTTGFGSNLAYVAAKAAVAALGVGLANVLGPNIRVLTVSPAGVPTNFIKGRDPQVFYDMGKKLPLQKVSEPADIAEAVYAAIAYLRSSTGIEILVDEGRNLRGKHWG